jgi:hypothetical protein
MNLKLDSTFRLKGDARFKFIISMINKNILLLNGWLKTRNNRSLNLKSINVKFLDKNYS